MRESSLWRYLTKGNQVDRLRLLQAVQILAAVPSENDGIDLLIAGGFSSTEALQLSELVPEAFAVPVVEALGVTNIVDEVSAVNRSGEWEKVPLRELSTFQSALTLAREQSASGILDQSAYKRIADRSCLVTTAINALNTGANIVGATMAIALIHATAEDLRDTVLTGE